MPIYQKNSSAPSAADAILMTVSTSRQTVKITNAMIEKVLQKIIAK